MKLRYLVLLAAFAAPSAALASQCDVEIKKVDAALASPAASLDSEAKDEAAAIREQAAIELAAGNEAACMATIRDATDLLDLT